MVEVVFPGLLHSPVVQLELVLVLAALAIGMGGFRLAVMDRIIQRCSKRPAAAFAICSVLALALHLMVAPSMTRHAPEIHDEFSYLLAADTFLHGSVANPPHPLWRSFETAHVLFWPHYASMYPPGQGLLLAAGKLIFGDYLAGPWLTSALFAGIAGWMLARVGTGALGGVWRVLGRPAIRRLRLLGKQLLGRRSACYRGHAPLRRSAAGLAKAADSRCGAGCLRAGPAGRNSSITREFWPQLPPCWFPRRSAGSTFLGWRHSLPAFATASAILALGGASLLYYNWRVTGNPLVMGYNLSMQRYGWAVFPWQSTFAANPPANREPGEVLRRLSTSGFRRTSHRSVFSPHGLVAFGRFWAFYIGPLFTLPLLAIPALAYSKRWRWILIAGVFYAIGLA